MRSLGSDWTAQQPSGNPPLNRQTAHCQQCRTASVVKFATSRLRPAMGIGRYEARGVVVRRVSSRRKAQAALAAVVRHSADERASRILRGAGLQSRRPRTRILSKAGRSRSTDVETVGRGRNPWRSSSELKADASCSPSSVARVSAGNANGVALRGVAVAKVTLPQTREEQHA
jgi:hypothetical protein